MTLLRHFATHLPAAWGLLLALSAPAAHGQTQVDASFGPMRVYQPATGAQVLVLSTGTRLVLSGNLLRADGVVTTQRLVSYSAAGVPDAAFAATIAGYSWVPQGLADAGAGRVFVTLGGPALLSGQTYYGLVRLLPSGAVDASFAAQPNTLNVSSLLVQPDGKVVVAGGFTMHNAQPVGNILRLNADGTHDFAFTFNSAGGLTGQTFRPVLALQPLDGGIVVGGSFRQAGSQPRSGLARFNADGTLDASFAPNTTATALVGVVAVQPDGRILAGTFNNVALVPNVTQMLVRFTATGVYDNSFVTPPIGVRTAFTGGATTLVVQPDGRILLAFSNGQVPPGGISRLTSSGAFDTSWSVPVLPAVTGSISSLQLLPGGQVAFAGTPQPLAGPTAVPAGVGQLTATGAPDTSVPVPTLQAAGLVRDVLVQPDGKVVVAGTFTEINGTPARALARLEANGQVDAAFTAACPVTGGSPTRLVLQPDGKLLVAGRFNTLGGMSAPSLGRVLASGVPDPAFVPALFASATFNVNSVSAIALQPNGAMALAGGMQLSSGGAFQRFLRLLPNGASDAGFQPPAGLFPVALLAEPSGRLVVGSTDLTQPVVQRLLPNGNPDASFVGPAGPAAGQPFSINGLSRYPDGRLLAFGNFTGLGGLTTRSVVRLASTGAVDPTFVSGLSATNVTVLAAALQPNGRVLVGGAFSGVGTGSQSLARLLPDGRFDFSLDGSLTPNSTVFALAVQSDGRLLVGGQFSEVGAGVAHLALVRLRDANVLRATAGANAPRTDAWPVPTHDQLHLRLDAAARPERVELFDGLGRRVLTRSVSPATPELSFDMTALLVGVYNLRVQYATGGSVMRRVVRE